MAEREGFETSSIEQQDCSERTGFAVRTERYYVRNNGLLARQDLAPPAAGHCGAAVVGRNGCPATMEILMTKARSNAKAKRNKANKHAPKKVLPRTATAKLIGSATREKTTTKTSP